MNKRPNQSAVKSGPALGIGASATVTKQSNVPEKRTALTRRIHYHVFVSKHPSSPRDVTSGVLLFCTCTSNRRRAKLLFPSRAGGSESGRAVFPGRHLVCPPPPTVSRIGGRYQQCAEAIYGGEEIYINQPADGGHALRKLRRGVWAPPPRLNELSVQSAETGGEKSRQGSRGSAYCPGLPAALPSLRQVDHVAARGTGGDG